MRKSIALFALVLVFMLAIPAFAQDATPTQEEPATAVPTEVGDPVEDPPAPPVEDQPPVDPQNIINVVLLVLVAVLVVGGILLNTALKGAYNSIPVVGRGPAKTLIEGLLDEGRRIVAGTPDPIDDEMFKIIERIVKDIIADQVPAAVDKELDKQMPAAIAKGVTQATQRYNPPS